MDTDVHTASAHCSARFCFVGVSEELNNLRFRWLEDWVGAPATTPAPLAVVELIASPDAPATGGTVAGGTTAGLSTGPSDGMGKESLSTLP